MLLNNHSLSNLLASRTLISALVLSAYCLVLKADPVAAQIPHLIRYQGQAVDARGVPLEGPYTLTFRLYDAQTAGTKLWEEAQPNVPLTHGYFSILLGSVNSLTTMNWSIPCWLSVQVNTDPELTPRQRITSVPLAMRAEAAEQADVAQRLATTISTSTISDDTNRLVPSGAIILWTGASCPTGYFRASALDGKFLAASSSYNPAAGGSNTHDHGGATGSHTLTIAEIPSHSHLLPTDACGSADNQSITGTANADESYDPSCAMSTGATGGGAGHTHPISAADSRPEFATVLLCQKD